MSKYIHHNTQSSIPINFKKAKITLFLPSAMPSKVLTASKVLIYRYVSANAQMAEDGYSGSYCMYMYLFSSPGLGSYSVWGVAVWSVECLSDCAGRNLKEDPCNWKNCDRDRENTYRTVPK